MFSIDFRGSYKWIVQVSVRPNYLDRKQRKVSLIFNHLEPEELAIHMSYLEYNSFRRLTVSERDVGSFDKLCFAIRLVVCCRNASSAVGPGNAGDVTNCIP